MSLGSLFIHLFFFKGNPHYFTSHIDRLKNNCNFFYFSQQLKKYLSHKNINLQFSNCCNIVFFKLLHLVISHITCSPQYFHIYLICAFYHVVYFYNNILVQSSLHSKETLHLKDKALKNQFHGICFRQ